MDTVGMHFGSMGPFALIESLIGYFVVLFWMFVAWRALRVLEKLSNTCDRLLQQKRFDQQDSETE